MGEQSSHLEVGRRLFILQKWAEWAAGRQSGSKVPLPRISEISLIHLAHLNCELFKMYNNNNGKKKKKSIYLIDFYFYCESANKQLPWCERRRRKVFEASLNAYQND